MTLEREDEVPFQAHVELLRSFLAQRASLVERIAVALNAQRQPAQYLQDRELLSRRLDECFCGLAALGGEPARLRGQLERAHWGSGFTPRRMPELHNDIVDPAELMVRGFYLWQQTRWPGRNARVRYAQTLFNLYLLRQLVLVSMRIWDAGAERAGERLARVGDLLDELWKTSPDDQPVLVGDARWLIPLAQSPTTDELAAYLEVAERVSEMPADADRLEIFRAHVLMIGGHLRSQTRHYCVKDGLSLDEASVVRRTRTSNALDFALSIQSLVSLLDAYERAADGGDEARRLFLADAICQAISPDPELFLNRVDLLGAYSMIEHLFVATDGGRAAYTPMGRRHVALVDEYAARIARSAARLHADCSRFGPADGTYSPYGAIFGTPTNLIEDMALKAIERDAVTRFALEDVFAGGDADKLAWVAGWRQLPHVAPEVREHYAYPQPFAADIHARIERELARCVSEEPGDLPETGRLHTAQAASAPDLPVRYVVSSDAAVVAANEAEPYETARLLHERNEGHFAVSYETAGGWVAVKKDFLTEVLGAGRDARLVGLPEAAAQTLGLMLPRLRPSRGH